MRPFELRFTHAFAADRRIGGDFAYAARRIRFSRRLLNHSTYTIPKRPLLPGRGSNRDPIGLTGTGPGMRRNKQEGVR